MKTTHKIVWTLLGAFALMAGCDKSGCTDPRASNFDMEAVDYDGSCEYNVFDLSGMLVNVGDQMILPRYAALESALATLKSTTDAFVAERSTANLSTANSALKTAYEKWQRCATFEIGPGVTHAIREHENAFPTNTSTVTDNIANQNYSLSNVGAKTTKGFSTLDYLLNDGTLTEVVDAFENDASRRDYLVAVVTELQDRFATVYSGWKSAGDNYIATFKNGLGTDLSSSLSLLVNEFVYDMELVKNAKIGVPAGKFTLGTPEPTQCEGYYSGNTRSYALASLDGLYDLFMGINEAGTDDLGLYDYLVNLGTEGSDGLLADEIKTKLLAVQADLETVANPLSDAFAANNGTVSNVYDEMKSVVGLLKTDMVSAFGVSINYVDSDGD